MQQHMAAASIDLALTQEPYAYRGKVLGVRTKDYEVIAAQSSSTNPRSCIVYRKTLDITPIPCLVRRDVVAALLKTREGSVLFVSLYLPNDENLPGTNLVDLEEYLAKSGLEAVICVDSNAHHNLWGSEDNNRRGESLVDFLYIKNNLDIVNEGNTPTFVCLRGSSIIDLTLATSVAKSRIVGWRVSDEQTLADHRYIKFIYGTEKPEPVFYRDPKRTDWGSYKEDLEIRLGNLRSAANEDDLDAVVDWLQQTIIGSFEANCQVRERRPQRQVAWWNAELLSQRRKLNKIFNRAKKTGEWEEHKSFLSLYKKNIVITKWKSWGSFCQSIESVPDRARLTKILKEDDSSRVSTLKMPNGEYTTSDEETLKCLLAAHFPGADLDLRPENDISVRQEPPSREDWETAREIFNYQKLKWAVNSFLPYKSAGPDGIFPKLLQEGLEPLGAQLIRIFRVSYVLGYIPKAWREVKVVFIPKPGRPTYHEAKSHRPISLTSFLLKTMEKLTLVHYKSGAMIERPLHANQWAYQSGKSGEGALHTLVGKIEKAMNNREIALAAFLDVEGAFDNTSLRTLEQAIVESGANRATCRWISEMLKKRTVQMSLKNTKIQARATRGCPQGGVWSPLLWCLVIDPLIRKLNEMGFFVQAFADDLVIMVIGKFAGALRDRLQAALKIVEKWCNQVGLRVNPLKTQVVAFTNKKKIDPPINITLFGEEVPLSSEVKYMGVTLDSKLLWRSHLEKTCKKANQLMWRCRRVVGQKWGLKPNVVHWLYVSVVRPVLTYAAVVWWKRTEVQSSTDLLGKIQRQALLSITGAMTTTPTAAMEAMLKLPPIDLVVKAEARAAIHRLQILEQWKPNGAPKSHTTYHGLLAETPILQMNVDAMATEMLFVENARFEIPERGSFIPSKRGIEWYTDGSKTLMGSGAGVYGERPRVEQYFSLGKHSSVFQAEVFALVTCIEMNLKKGYRQRPITIFTDSQAAIKSLENPKTNSKLVKNCKDALNRLARVNQVTICWVPGHEGIDGNEKADILAKSGAESSFVGPEPAVGISRDTCKLEIRNWLEKEHLEKWKGTFALNHSKLFIKHPSKERKANELLSYGRSTLKTIIETITGHCSLRKHLHTMGKTPEPDCRKCGWEDETGFHVLCDCPAIMAIRNRIFGRHILTPQQVMEEPLWKVAQLIKEAGLAQ